MASFAVMAFCEIGPEVIFICFKKQFFGWKCHRQKRVFIWDRGQLQGNTHPYNLISAAILDAIPLTSVYINSSMDWEKTVLLPTQRWVLSLSSTPGSHMWSYSGCRIPYQKVCSLTVLSVAKKGFKLIAIFQLNFYIVVFDGNYDSFKKTVISSDFIITNYRQNVNILSFGLCVSSATIMIPTDLKTIYGTDKEVGPRADANPRPPSKNSLFHWRCTWLFKLLAVWFKADSPDGGIVG